MYNKYIKRVEVDYEPPTDDVYDEAVAQKSNKKHEYVNNGK